MDQRSLNNLYTLHPNPEVRKDAIEAWTEVQAAMPDHVQVIVIEGARSFEKTDRLYKLGRTVVNADGRSAHKPFGDIVSNAIAGESYHDYGLAFDFAMITNGKDDDVVGPNWMKVVAIMQNHGWTWGGNFPKKFVDAPHFEKKLGYNWRTLLKLYNQGKFIPGTNFLNI